ncbi:hypothetical protein PaG_05864 [Moesziomyces aphidis]|uniref:Uncharacterized protein n=1 Tax=Moesziomyces aphidis TaxID=84754 RepID=W3VEB8_MOEAP|nr:hypothetical protein PaG_05864 [Moesziomyces aphidis]
MVKLCAAALPARLPQAQHRCTVPARWDALTIITYASLTMSTWQDVQKLPLLPLQHDQVASHLNRVQDAGLPHPTHPLSKLARTSASWTRHLNTLAERSSTGLVPWLIVLPLLASVLAHVYFHMFSTLHIYLALVWLGVPAATVSTLAAIASRSATKSASGRDRLKATVLLTLLCTVIRRTFTVNPRQAFSNDPYEQSQNQTFFIAVDMYNSEHLFPSFSQSLLTLAERLGKSNVFVSIYESNSKDSTKQHLLRLQSEFGLRGISNQIRMIDNSRREELDRIQRLAMVRNEALRPIHDGIDALNNQTFSKLIWLNDILFRPESVLELLSTNGGTFDQVCALDYLPLGFYDTWVMRDVEGDRPTPLWPYFKREKDVNSLRRGDTIPVNSCWNGMTIFDAKWFLPSNDSATGTPGVDDGPIRFRTHPECNVSECLLPSYDIHVRSKSRPLIFVNPRAVATYQYRDFLMYDRIMRSNIVTLWSRVWQDLISHSLFGFMVEIGRKKDECADTLRKGWKT